MIQSKGGHTLETRAVESVIYLDQEEGVSGSKREREEERSQGRFRDESEIGFKERERERLSLRERGRKIFGERERE